MAEEDNILSPDDPEGINDPPLLDITFTPAPRPPGSVLEGETEPQVPSVPDVDVPAQINPLPSTQHEINLLNAPSPGRINDLDIAAETEAAELKDTRAFADRINAEFNTPEEAPEPQTPGDIEQDKIDGFAPTPKYDRPELLPPPPETLPPATLDPNSYKPSGQGTSLSDLILDSAPTGEEDTDIGFMDLAWWEMPLYILQPFTAVGDAVWAPGLYDKDNDKWDVFLSDSKFDETMVEHAVGRFLHGAEAIGNAVFPKPSRMREQSVQGRVLEKNTDLEGTNLVLATAVAEIFGDPTIIAGATVFKSIQKMANAGIPIEQIVGGIWHRLANEVLLLGTPKKIAVTKGDLRKMADDKAAAARQEAEIQEGPPDPMGDLIVKASNEGDITQGLKYIQDITGMVTDLWGLVARNGDLNRDRGSAYRARSRALADASQREGRSYEAAHVIVGENTGELTQTQKVGHVGEDISAIRKDIIDNQLVSPKGPGDIPWIIRTIPEERAMLAQEIIDVLESLRHFLPDNHIAKFDSIVGIYNSGRLNEKPNERGDYLRQGFEELMDFVQDDTLEWDTWTGTFGPSPRVGKQFTTDPILVEDIIRSMPDDSTISSALAKAGREARALGMHVDKIRILAKAFIGKEFGLEDDFMTTDIFKDLAKRWSEKGSTGLGSAAFGGKAGRFSDEEVRAAIESEVGNELLQALEEVFDFLEEPMKEYISPTLAAAQEGNPQAIEALARAITVGSESGGYTSKMSLADLANKALAGDKVAQQQLLNMHDDPRMLAEMSVDDVKELRSDFKHINDTLQNNTGGKPGRVDMSDLHPLDIRRGIQNIKDVTRRFTMNLRQLKNAATTREAMDESIRVNAEDFRKMYGSRSGERFGKYDALMRRLFGDRSQGMYPDLDPKTAEGQSILDEIVTQAAKTGDNVNNFDAAIRNEVKKAYKDAHWIDRQSDRMPDIDFFDDPVENFKQIEPRAHGRTVGGKRWDKTGPYDKMMRRLFGDRAQGMFLHFGPRYDMWENPVKTGRAKDPNQPRIQEPIRDSEGKVTGYKETQAQGYIENPIVIAEKRLMEELEEAESAYGSNIEDWPKEWGDKLKIETYEARWVVGETAVSRRQIMAGPAGKLADSAIAQRKAAYNKTVDQFEEDLLSAKAKHGDDAGKWPNDVKNSFIARRRDIKQAAKDLEADSQQATVSGNKALNPTVVGREVSFGQSKVQMGLLEDLMGQELPRKRRAELMDLGADYIYGLRQTLAAAGEEVLRFAEAARSPTGVGHIEHVAAEKAWRVAYMMSEMARGIDDVGLDNRRLYQGMAFKGKSEIAFLREAKRAGRYIEDHLRTYNKMQDALAAVEGRYQTGAAAIRVVNRGFRSGPTDIAFNYFLNDILSGPVTQSVNAITTAGVLLLRPTQSFFYGLSAAAEGDLREADAQFKQVARMFVGSRRGAVDAMKLLAHKALTMPLVDDIVQDRWKPNLGFMEQYPDALGSGNYIHAETRKKAFSSRNIPVGNMFAHGTDFIARQFDLQQDTRSKINRIARASGDRPINAFGSLTRIPTTGLGGVDRGFKMINFQMSKHIEASRMASMKSKSDADFEAVYNYFLKFPTESAMERGIRDAEYYTFTKNLDGAWGNMVKHLVRNPAGRWMVPFTQTPVNLIKFGLNHSIPGVLMDAYRTRDLMKGGVRGQQARARAAMAGIATTGIMMSMSDGVTGWYDSQSPEGRHRTLNADPKLTWRIGDNYFDYGRIDFLKWMIGPIATVKDMMNDADYEDKEQWEQITAVGVAYGGAILTLMTESFLWPQIGDTYMIVEALKNGDFDDAGRWVQRLGASMIIPAFVNQFNHAYYDDVFRQADEFAQKIDSRIPNRSRDLRPYLDLWGDEATRPERFGPDLISPFEMRNVSPSEMDLILRDLKVSIPYHKRMIQGVKLTNDQRYDYEYMRGKGRNGNQPLERMLLRTVRSGMYRNASPEGKKALLEGIIRKRGDSAKSWLMQKYPKLRKDIILHQRNEQQALRRQR